MRINIKKNEPSELMFGGFTESTEFTDKTNLTALALEEGMNIGDSWRIVEVSGNLALQKISGTQ